MKRVFSLILSLTILCAMSSVVSAASTVDIPSSPYSIATVQTSVPISNSQNNIFSISTLNNLPISALQDFDFIVLDESSLVSLTKETAVAFLQSGGVLGVDTSNTDAAISDLYTLLDVEKPVTIGISGAEDIGAYITMRNGKLVPGVFSQVLVDTPNIEETPFVSETDFNDTTLGLIEKIDTDNFLSHIETMENSTPPMVVSNDPEVLPMTAPSGFDYEDDAYITYKSNKVGNEVMASAFVTQYVYEACSYRSNNGQIVDISDIVSNVVVDAGRFSYIETYTTRLGVNGGTMSIIDQTYINSNSSTSTSLSGGFSADSNSLISGSISAAVTYTYDTNNQTVTNNFVSSMYHEWISDPTALWEDASWVLEPGIRVKNANTALFDNSAYTDIEDIVVKWHYMGGEAGTETVIPDVRVTIEW